MNDSAGSPNGNWFFGRIDFGSNNVASEIQSDTEFRKGQVELHAGRIRNFRFDAKRFSYSEKAGVLCAAIGYVSNLEAVRERHNIESESDVEIFRELYSRMGLGFVAELGGIFAAFIFDENARKAYVVQGRYGSHLAIYYTRVGSSVFFSTSLKQLLKRARFERKLNSAAVADLLYYQFNVPNAPTLIEGVKKLIPTQYLAIDCRSGAVRTGFLKRTMETESPEVAKGALLESIQAEAGRIFSQLENKDSIAVPLSGGFDTNFMLHTLSTTTEASLNAFTIGGKEVNEIPQTREIMKSYPNAKHVARVLDEEVVDLLPEIVWRLEGSVVGAGIFLAYELSKSIAESRHTSAFLSNCADQQLRGNPTYRLDRRIKRHLKASFIGDIYQRITQRRLILDYYYEMNWILRLSGTLLNSFGIQGIYPYLNQETETLASSLGKLSIEKTFYKGEVKKAVGPEIAKSIARQPGKTDVDYLLDAREDTLTGILGSEPVKSIIERASAEWPNEKAAAPDPLRLCCVYLFKRLFIDGEYDEMLDAENLAAPLETFL